MYQFKVNNFNLNSGGPHGSDVRLAVSSLLGYTIIVSIIVIFHSVEIHTANNNKRPRPIVFYFYKLLKYNAILDKVKQNYITESFDTLM